jgi:hypothetical protein
VNAEETTTRLEQARAATAQVPEEYWEDVARYGATAGAIPTNGIYIRVQERVQRGELVENMMASQVPDEWYYGVDGYYTLNSFHDAINQRGEWKLHSLKNKKTFSSHVKRFKMSYAR